ncbi:MAG: sigma-70 family RNA polymerase sigma factor [Candidatus Latescibacteria bacterium]|nr:sigma-70 family RNA polymerase sigma factor [Candidatus Latescibacterota bacterium]
MQEDRELVAKALAGGPEAFGPIVEQYQGTVFAVALSRLGNFHEAEDVAQQVFVEAFQRLGRLRDPARLGAWLRSATVNRCIDLLRRNKEDLGLDPEELASHGPSPEEKLERREVRDQVMAAISRLPPKQRETVTLFYISGHSIQEIAALQGVPTGSIKRRLYDARARLREEMLEMVDTTLKAEAPKEDFSKRVFELLNRKGLSQEPSVAEVPGIVSELRTIGIKGVEGLVQALRAPDWQTRTTALWMIKESGVAPEPAVDLLKQLLTDTNQRVRGSVPAALLSLRVGEERKRQEFLPLIVPLMADPAKEVRRGVASMLRGWAADVPLEAAARALAKEMNGGVRRYLASVILGILEYCEKKAAP